MAAYAYYRDNKYDEAIGALDRFIQLHPGNRDVAYAYYLKALCYYEQIADVGRDQEMTEQALRRAAGGGRPLPEQRLRPRRRASRSTSPATISPARRWRSAATICTAQQYLAAINRFRSVVENYQTTTHVPEALHRLTECYLALGVDRRGAGGRRGARLQLSRAATGTRTATRC